MTTTPPTTEPTHQASLEHLLLRFGLVTLDQLSAALREQTEVGTPFTEVLVRDGIVSADDLARVADRAPAPQPEPVAAEPEPVSEPEPVPAPVAEPEPAPVLAEPDPVQLPEPLPAAVAAPEPVSVPEPLPLPEPAPPVAATPAPVAFVPEPEPLPLIVTGYVVRGHLVNGEDVEIASVDDAAEAQRIARDAMRACARSDGNDWPILNGRYVRPESIVSIEVAERY